MVTLEQKDVVFLRHTDGMDIFVLDEKKGKVLAGENENNSMYELCLTKEDVHLRRTDLVTGKTFDTTLILKVDYCLEDVKKLQENAQQREKDVNR